MGYIPPPPTHTRAKGRIHLAGSSNGAPAAQTARRQLKSIPHHIAAVDGFKQAGLSSPPYQHLYSHFAATTRDGSCRKQHLEHRSTRGGSVRGKEQSSL